MPYLDTKQQTMKMAQVSADYDIQIAYHPSKANVVVDALNRILVMCGARHAPMGIKYEDQFEDVADKQLVVVMARLTSSLSFVDHIK